MKLKKFEAFEKEEEIDVFANRKKFYQENLIKDECDEIATYLYDNSFSPETTNAVLRGLREHMKKYGVLDFSPEIASKSEKWMMDTKNKLT